MYTEYRRLHVYFSGNISKFNMYDVSSLGAEFGGNYFHEKFGVNSETHGTYGLFKYIGSFYQK